MSIAFLLEDMGCLAAQSGTPKLALHLIGAASTLRKSINIRLSELEQKKVDQLHSSARNSINESEASTAWSQVAAMTLDEAVEYAYNNISLPTYFFSIKGLKMDQPDFDTAKEFALQLLETRLSPQLIYHSVEHTRDGVVPTAQKLAEMEGISDEEKLLVVTAAYYHDLGHIEGYLEHEETSIRIAEQNLPEFNYSPEQIAVIRDIIRATRMPQSPTNLLGKIMADSDLDILGREDYFKRNIDLRIEFQVVRGHQYTDLEWYSSQIKLLETHQYFTDSAKVLSEDGQRRNLEAVRRLIQLLEENKHIDLDKLVILKSVNIFSAIPEEALVEAVALLEEVKVKSGQTIMEKGDHGSSMFIIADGKMLVHDGELTLNYLYRYDIFGEMAALDPQVRSASITAIENTTLYKLDQKDLLYLVETHSAVTRGIFHILSQRLRNVMQDRADDFDYIQQFERVIAAAVALETGAYKPQMIDEVTKRTDELGQLARVFQRMAREVEAREDRLKREVKELRIEIDKVKQARQVAEITDTEYFQELRSKVRQLRSERDSEEGK